MTRQTAGGNRRAGRAAALLLALALPCGAGAETLKIGVLDYLGSGHSRTHWEPTLQALRRALPGHGVELQALGLAALDAALAEDRLDFVITNPGNYAELEYRHHVSRIATAEGDLPVASTLVAAAPLAGLGDLAGRRLAIVSPEAFGGFELIWAEMARAEPGLKGRVELVVTGYPMQAAAAAVLDGRAEAAVLRACMLEALQRQDPARYGALHAFALRPSPEAAGCAVSSAVYPGWAFARTRTTPPALAKEVAVALMQIGAGNLWTVPHDYQGVHALMRELQIGPYRREGPVPLREVLADYRDWLIAALVALAFWAVYSVRIETLVRRRTRALDSANARLLHEMAERQRAEEADRQHRRELEHVARLSILGEMASAVAHELNQPLAAISNYAQGCLLRLRAGSLAPEEMSRASAEIAAQSERAATVIRRIRAFVRKRESQRAPVAIPGLLEECEALYGAPARRAGIRVERDCAPGLPAISGDRVQLTQVVLNLVQNALDAMAGTPPAARLVTIRARAQADPRDGPGVCLSVRDRGTGMDAAALAHFAEPFHTTKAEGIGLGLALSRSIVEAHGGAMRAAPPQDGPGLEVLVWLPAEGMHDG
ncbi:PhnD/SsuA/transferrin family substrate-binding protein [Poseidonocella sp. HB161398]|uniref:sensor histidine kinase n=1 Tax=Poseidonocella sp. HB161398 TaxID=2320855 RepID=UPI001486A4BC|nr:PhnD/SsuA/transferrin family substrate-binding protein [Poseidonocella sp. HB161398]